MYKYLKQLWKSPNKEILKERILKWRREQAITKLEKPTNIARARSLGYKAKQGYIVARVRLPRGGRMRPQIKKGRRTKHRRHVKILSKSYQTVAEERAQKKFKNLEVLNSYNLTKDGKYYWIEVILVDPNHPVIKSDPKINWIGNQKKRVYRGLTSSGRKSRGMRKKGLGSEKTRPSMRANKRRAH